MDKRDFCITKNGAVVLIAAVTLLAAFVWIFGSIRNSGRETGIFDRDNFATRPVMAVSEAVSHGEISMKHIEFINDNFYNRFSFSYRELYTAQWIVEELLSMGYTWDDIEVQEFTWDASRDTYPMESFDILPGVGAMDIFFMLDSMPFIHLDLRPSQMSQNVILTVPGKSEQFIVVGAHYDSVMYPGASDNASGTALLLESAQRMRYLDNYYTIVYVFFGAEEVGILGAFYYINSWSQQEHDNLLFMINADVLLDGPDLFYMAGYSSSHSDSLSGANHITETWDTIAQAVSAEHGINLMPFPQGAFGPSDQLAFIYNDHTVMFLIGMNEVDGWYDQDIMNVIFEMATVLHSPRDDFHYINQTWPGKIEMNMHAFSIFLEELLLGAY